VREHAAVREGLGRLADGVDERVVGAPLEHRRHDDLAEARPGCRQAVAQAGGCGVAGRWHGGAAAEGRDPHLQLADEPVGGAPQRRGVVDALDRQLDRAVQHRVIEGGNAVDDVADQHQVVVEHADDDVHGGAPSGRGDQEAPR